MNIKQDVIEVLDNYDISTTFKGRVLKEADNIQEIISDEDLVGRKDLRNKLIISIDGQDTKDIDDAISIDINNKGNYILGVHIADVSHYVINHSEIDKEAYYRGTSIYFLNSVIPMLPQKLSNGVCSLSEGKDRLAVSVMIEIDKNNGYIVNKEVFNSVINVRKNLSYENVQQCIDNKKHFGKVDTKILEKILLMNKLAIILKKKRIKNGYISLNIPETKIISDKNYNIFEVTKYKSYFSNEIIEQFMITANESVAELLQGAPCIYRVHPEGNYTDLLKNKTFMEITGNNVYLKNLSPHDIQRLISKYSGIKQEIISYSFLRSMNKAYYSEINIGHYGIGSNYYCHFTSPIRRYPDLVVHRILKHYMSDKNYSSFKDLKVIAKQCSDTEEQAKEIEREMNKLAIHSYCIKNIGMIYEGSILKIGKERVSIKLDNTIKGYLKIKNKKSANFKLAEKIFVKIKSVSLKNGIEFELI